MRISDFKSYPLIGMVKPYIGSEVIFSVLVKEDITVVHTHFLVKGYFRKLVLIDSAGKTYEVENLRIKGVSWKTLRDFGFLTSFFTATIFGFDYPLQIDFELGAVERIDFELLKSRVADAVNETPNIYTRKSKRSTVLNRLNRGNNFVDLARSISNSGR